MAGSAEREMLPFEAAQAAGRNMGNLGASAGYEKKARDHSPPDVVSGAAPAAYASDRYSASYIGFLSNGAFSAFINSIEDDGEKRGMLGLRQQWFNEQKDAYGTSASGRPGQKQGEAMRLFSSMTGGTSGKIEVIESTAFASGSGIYMPSTDEGNWKIYNKLKETGNTKNGASFNDNGYLVTCVQVSPPTKSLPPEVHFRIDGADSRNKPPSDSSFVMKWDAKKNSAINAGNWLRMFKGLQAFPNEWNLSTYNSWLPMAVGLVGNMDSSGYITAQPARRYGDTTLAFAAELVRYHYADMGESEGMTYSQYQRNCLEQARALIGQNNWGGKFTSEDKRFSDYGTLGMDELGTDPVELGKMANAYNRQVAQDFTAIANYLQWGGINISGERGLSPATLRDYIDQMEGRVAGEGSSGYTDTDIEEVNNLYDEWYMYKTGVNNIHAAAQRLEGEDWADFIIAYCGAESDESIRELWPWWEPRSALEPKLIKAQEMKEFYNGVRENEQKARDAGFVSVPQNEGPKDEDEKQTGGAGRGGVGVSWNVPQSEERENWSEQGAGQW